MGVFLLFAVAAAVAVYEVWAREKRKTAETEAQSARALDEREKELAGERDKCAELRRLLAETREMLDEERRLRADDEKEIRNIMNYDGTADSQEALDEK